MTFKEKWHYKNKAFLCKCGKVFLKRNHFTEHIKDTKRWRKYHYAPDIREVGFVVWIIDKHNLKRSKKKEGAEQ